jgi:hypothetical protein
MFPEMKTRETLRDEEKGIIEIRGKQNNYFPREQTLSVFFYSDERKINNIHTTFIQHSWQFYAVNEFKIKRRN